MLSIGVCTYYAVKDTYNSIGSDFLQYYDIILDEDKRTEFFRLTFAVMCTEVVEIPKIYLHHRIISLSWTILLQNAFKFFKYAVR
jgi:hypothetical protein